MTEDKRRARELKEKDLLCNLDKNRQAAQARGQPFEVLMPDDIVDVEHGNEVGLVVVTFGMRGDLTKREADVSAKDWLAQCKHFPNAKFYLQIAGYDDDPRELDEFPEVTRYVRRFARMTGLDDVAAADKWLLPPCIGLLAMCGVFGEAIRQEGLRSAPPRTTPQ